MEEQSNVHSQSIKPGEVVYDSDRRPIGRVSGLTDNGFEAETIGFDEGVMEELPGKEFGEGYLMWRCGECGDMGELDEGMPDTCPNCGAPGEWIAAVEED